MDKLQGGKSLLSFIMLLMFVVLSFGAIIYFQGRINLLGCAPAEEICSDGVSVSRIYLNCQVDPRPLPKLPEIIGIPNKIIVYSPGPSEEIASPLEVKGRARGTWFFEASFPVEIYDDNNKLLGSAPVQFTPKSENDTWMTTEFIEFEGKIEFSQPTTKTGYMLFKKDNPSGLSEYDEQFKMAIKFKGVLAPAKKIKLYYYNVKKDKEIADYISCGPEAILPVEREIPITKTPIQDAVKLLLEGRLSEEEKNNGFLTEFPLSGFKLLEANLKNGVLILKFDDPENKISGGSCRAGILWSQIEKTVKQFSEVKEVKFLSETIFQP
jgi:hypothetical protein